jgi:hypothetical protein
MSYYFPPDEALQQKARAKYRKMLLQKCFMERREAVENELKWVITGRPNEEQHQKILPDYCYNIFDLQRRTIFKAFAPISEVITFKDKERAVACKKIEEAKQFMTIDWEKLGSVIEMGERSLRFLEIEMEEKLRREGLSELTLKKDNEIYRLVFGDCGMKRKMAEIQTQAPEGFIKEIFGKRNNALVETIKKAVAEWHQKAVEWEPEAVTKFHAGVLKASDGFLDKNGDLKGERKIKLKKTYELLLIAWPEIEEMLKADPPKTRNYLWDWLLPFSYAYWIEIQDLEQLNRLCTAIKLTLKEPGAPCKSK